MMNDELGRLFVKELSSSAESAEETSTMAPIHTQIFPLQHPDEIRTPIHVSHNSSQYGVISVMQTSSAVGSAVHSAFLYLNVSLLIDKSR